MDPSLSAKLRLRPEMSAAAIAPPAGFPLLRQHTADPPKPHSLDYAHFFADTPAAFSDRLRQAAQWLRPGGLLWASYPKQKPSAQALNRDSLWDLALHLGFHPVAQVSLDDVWSAVRLKENVEGETYARPVASGQTRRGQQRIAGGAAAVDGYLSALPEPQRARCTAVVAYLRQSRPNCTEGLYVTAQNAFPVFCSPDGVRSAGVAGRKGCVSLYLTDPAALDALKQAAPALSYGKCCARISDRAAFPWEAVRAAIDRCLRS